MKQSSHTNQCHTLHKFFIYTIWILDLLRYISPKLLLRGLRHELPILDGDEDIVAQIKWFERFLASGGSIGSPFKSSVVT
jgi:hypothetical protein